MPQGPAARLGDPVAHPLPPVLTGVPALKVLIGMQPAWKGIPLAAAPGIMAANTSTEAKLQALETTAKVAEAAALAAAGTPAAPGLVVTATAARLAAETAKLSSVAANSASIAAAAAGGASMHICALPWPLPPHGPGVVIDGSPTVMIENCPACRVGDTIIEAIGPPNKIVMGCMTVIIGDSGSGGGGGAGAGTGAGAGAGAGAGSAGAGAGAGAGSAGAGAGAGAGSAGAGAGARATAGGSAAPAAPAASGGVKWEKQPGATDEDLKKAKQMWEDAKTRRLPDGSKPDTVKAIEALEKSGKTTVIKVGSDGNFEVAENEADGKNPAKGTNTTINFNPNKTAPYGDGVARDPECSLVHEAVHAQQDTEGKTPATQKDQEVGAATAENQHRKAKKLPQRQKYGTWDIPQA